MSTRQRDVLRHSTWVVIYLLFILAPLLVLLLGTPPPSRGFWTEFAIALGYSGLAIMGLQLGLTARFRHVTAPWGEDVIYHFHRRLSLVATRPFIVVDDMFNAHSAGTTVERRLRPLRQNTAMQIHSARFQGSAR